MRSIKIGNKEINSASNSLVIAEVACGHEGNFEIANQLIDVAAEAGADAIKFHHHSADDYLTQDHPLFDFVKKVNFSKEKWKELYKKAKNNGLLVVGMPNDLSSLRVTENLQADAYYLHSANLGDFPFIINLARTGKPILIGTGATTFDETKKTIKLIKKQNNNNIVLMHGYQAYPTKIEENHLRMIQKLKEEFGLMVGFCDHTDGNSEIAKILPMVALAFGAKVIEKHFTLNRSLKLVDYESALNPQDLKDFITNLRLIEKTFGSDKHHDFSDDEKKYRNLVKKNVVAKNDLEIGQIITLSDLAFKRSKNLGMSPFDYEKLINKKAKINIKKDDLIILELLE